MKISSKGRYGLRALIDLASSDEENCTKLKNIAKRQGISEYYLEQIIAPLKKAGIVKSIRGFQGGYILNKPPAEISVGDILRVLEGPLYPVDCLSENESSSPCGTANCEACATRSVWERIYTSINTVLDSIYLSELVEDYKSKLKELI